MVDFEGNANALRLLTHQFAGRRQGGFGLTLTTVAAIVKYPYASGTEGLKKYGFFQSEKATYLDLAERLGLQEQADRPGVFARHPLVYLVDRKSTRLNSSHVRISYAVFCLKKKT